jgi:hypothetical protein
MEARSGQQPVFAARPKLQADFGDVVGWLEAKPGKWLVVSGSLSRHGQRSLDPIGRCLGPPDMKQATLSEPEVGREGDRV